MATSPTEANPFDQFDAKPSAEANPFDQFDEKPKAAAAPAPAAPKTKEPGVFERLGTEAKSLKQKAGELMDSLSGPPKAGSYGSNWKQEGKDYYAGGGMLNGPNNLSPGVGLKTASEALAGALEAPLAMGAGAATAAAGGLAGGLRAAGGVLAEEPLDTALSKGADVATKTMGMAYEPKTQMGKFTTNMIGAPMALAKEATGAVGGSVGRVLGNEALGQTLGENAPEILMGKKVVGDIARMARTPTERAPLTQKQQAQNAAVDMGYRAPAGTSQGALSSLVESVGGERHINTKAALKNQEVTNTKARAAFNINKDTPLNADTFNEIRDKAGERYAEVKRNTEPVKLDAQYDNTIRDLDANLRPVQREFAGLGRNPKIEQLQAALSDKAVPKSTTGILDTIKELRAESTRLYRSTVADDVAAAAVYRRGANALEQQLDRHFADRLSPAKMDEYRSARKDIAASHDLEIATNPVTGDVDAGVLARMLKKGKPLSGELREIAEAGRTFKSTVKNTETTGGTAIAAGDAATGAILHFLVHGGINVATLGARPLASSIASSGRYNARVNRAKGAKLSADGRGILAKDAAGTAFTMSGERRKKDEAANR